MTTLQSEEREVSIPLGTKLIVGKWVEFNLILDVSHNRSLDSFFVRATVPFPDNYPPTLYALNPSSYEVDFDDPTQRSVLRIVFSLKFGPPQASGFTAQQAPVFLDLWKSHGFTHHLWLNHFYVYPRVSGIKLEPSELEAFSGFGTRTLCFILHLIDQAYHPSAFTNPSKTMVLLEASGGAIRTEQDRELVQRLVSSGEVPSSEEAEALVIQKNQDKLVSFYQALSFRIVPENDPENLEVLMWTDLTSLLHICTRVSRDSQ